MLDRMIIDVCKRCKAGEVVKREGQEAKLKCDVLKSSVFLEGCMEGLEHMSADICLKCKASQVVRRPQNNRVKLECIVVRGVLPLDVCVSDLITGEENIVIEETNVVPKGATMSNVTIIGDKMSITPVTTSTTAPAGIDTNGNIVAVKPKRGRPFGAKTVNRKVKADA